MVPELTAVYESAGMPAALQRAQEIMGQEESAAPEGDARYSFQGYDAETGEGIYQSNFPKGTPKAAKAQRILSLIQNVWSKKPINLVVKNGDGTTRTIQAQFDPTYDESPHSRTDASKLMGGNRHGSAAEQRVTLDLADDYYQIASEAVHNYSKDETGKESAPHAGVKQWHYFINDIQFQEYGEEKTTPYRVTLNVKERDDGSFVYSFSAERQNKGLSTRQTLHADVIPTESGGDNTQPDTSIRDTSENSNPAEKFKKDSRLTAEDVASLERMAGNGATPEMLEGAAELMAEQTAGKDRTNEQTARKDRPDEQNISDDGGVGREPGAGTGRPGGRVPENAGGKQGQRRRAVAGTEGARILALCEDHGERRVSAKEIGIPGGTDSARLYAVKPEWCGARLQNVARHAEAQGLTVTLVHGEIEIRGRKKTATVTGLRDGDHIWINVGARLHKGEALALHEYAHTLLDGDAQLIQAGRRALQECLTPAQAEQLTVKYAMLYENLYGGITEWMTEDEQQEVSDLIMVEVMCDALAEINRARAPGAVKATAAMREMLREETGVDVDAILNGETQTETAETETPPVREDAATAAVGNKGPTRYSYGGTKAEHADLQELELAEAMEQEGEDAETIRQETGWFRGADGKWRFEIDDSGMQYHERRAENGDVPGQTLADYITHDELFRNYPQLRRVGLEFAELEEGVNGEYNRKTNTITLAEKLRNAPEATIVHEVQHAIQKAEGFSGGSNTQHWNRKLEEGYDGRTQEQRQEERRLREEYNRIRDNEPEFFGDMNELEAMTPDMPRGKIDWDTLEQIEEDPIEWQRYDEVREAMEEKYGDTKVWDFTDLRYRMQQAEQNRGRTPTDLYYDTAGEIEARDSARRKDLTREERRKKMPDLGNEDTVFADAGDYGYAMSADEQASIKEQLNQNRTMLDSMEPVAVLNRNDLVGLTPGQARVRLTEALKKTGYKVDRPDFGIIQFTEKELNNSLNYKERNAAAEDARRTAMLALPQVLKRGKEISGHQDHKGRGYGTTTIAAPVEINGKRGNMAVVVRETKGNRYKVHRILTPDGGAYVLEKMDSAEGYPVGGITGAVQTPGEVTPANFLRADDSISRDGENSNTRYSADEDYAAEAAAEKPMALRDKRLQAEAKIEVYRKLDSRTPAQEAELQELIAKRDAYKAEQKKRAKARLAEKQAALAARETTEARIWELDGLEERTPEQEAERKELQEKRAAYEAADVPNTARGNLRRKLMEAFQIRGDYWKFGEMIDAYTEKYVREKKLTQADLDELFDKLLLSGTETVPADEAYESIRALVRNGHIYVPESVVEEFGDDYEQFRKRAFANGIYLNQKNTNLRGIDEWTNEIANSIGLVDESADLKKQLETIVELAEEGKAENMTLSDMAERIGRLEGNTAQEAYLDELERKMTAALREFAAQAKIEMQLQKKSLYQQERQRQERLKKVEKQRARRQLQEMKKPKNVTGGREAWFNREQLNPNVIQNIPKRSGMKIKKPLINQESLDLSMVLKWCSSGDSNPGHPA